MINWILEKIKSQEMRISQWMLGFLGIVFVRFILESLSSPATSGIIPSDPYTLIHYGLFWITLTLGLILIIGYWTKDYLSSSKIALFGLPVIWMAPILDMIISRGNGFTESYIFDSGSKLALDFFTFFGPNLAHGATYGIRIEMAIVLFGIGFYLWKITKSTLGTALGVIWVYIFGFMMSSLPGIIYTLSHTQAGTVTEILNYFQNIILNSTIVHNTLREGVSSVSSSRFFELGFDKFISQILFIVSTIFAGFLLCKINSRKFWAVIKNSRPERIGSYIALLLCGVGFAYINKLNLHLVWIDTLGIVCLIISWISLWMQAVHVNDIADVRIDEISNSDRPLVQREMDAGDMRETGYVWLALALLGSWCVGFYPFFMSLVYISCSYVYSVPPLRLRRFPLVSSFLISVACLATILSGFFFLSVNKQIQTFPMLLAVGIIVMVTLAINVKDMKDIPGDIADEILTLPILFGKGGAKIVALCFALSLLLVPVFLSFYFLYIIAIPCALVGYKLIVRKPYSERPVFILRFVFLACIALSYLIIYWLGHVYNLI